MRSVAVFALLIQTCLVTAQSTFNMSNNLVTDCEGTLLDSENGNNGTTYANNENFIFKICSGGKITMTFNSTFCIDSGFDFLRIFNGPDTNSPLLGKYTGYTAPPPRIATSGCMTLHFKSDASAAYCGWEADWTTEKVPPLPPVMDVNPVPACSTNQIKLTYTKKIFCDSVLPSDFIVTGPVSGIIVNSLTSSLNCSSSDSTTTFTLHLNKNLDKNCWYKVKMDLGLPDNCDSIWHFNLLDSFMLKDCSFSVNIVANPDTICPGTCTKITAVIAGGGSTCLNYNYTWNQGLPNSPGPHTVCPFGAITYTVSVQPVGGGYIASAMKTIVFVNPVITEAETLTVCQSDTAFAIKVNVLGGKFYGQGIINQFTGIFDPNTAGGGQHYIKYKFTKTCADSILIIVKSVDAGLNEAACPGTPPFLLKGFSPPGGVWSGDSVKANGLFNPALSGKYKVTYTVNGCSESKFVFVDSVVLNTPLSSVCQVTPAFNISISPPGGKWSGPGITDSIAGTFNPAVAGPGIKTLTYKLSGSGACTFSISVTVLQIGAGVDIIVCPAQPQFFISPAGIPTGGTWKGLGIVNSITGLYNPAQAFGGGEGNDTLRYTHSNGCSDDKIIYVRKTVIAKDTVFFCYNSPAFYLDFTTVGRSPGGGIWTGPGLTNPSGRNYYFNPTISGIGTFKLYYTINTCTDSVLMIVYPPNIKKFPFNALWPDTTVCSTHPSWNFPVMPPGGKWKGKGITNPLTGSFSPAVAGPGIHFIKYATPGSCVNDSVMVTVYAYKEASITGLNTSYCYSDTLISFNVQPPNGQLSGNGLVNGANFNPSIAGKGTHTITYTFGNGFCKTDTSITIVVSDPISMQFNVSDTMICPGESVTIKIVPKGGKEGQERTFVWKNGYFPVDEHILSPLQSAWFAVMVGDGCSDPVTDSVYIIVSDEVKAEVTTSKILCYGADGFASVAVDSTEGYDIEWSTNPPSHSSKIEGVAGSSYALTVTDKETGCTFDSLVRIPSYKNVVAAFSVSPNFECIPSNQKLVTFLDLSFNADSGTWDIAGLATIPYKLGENPQYQFTNAGYYAVTLTVFNEGGCSAEYQMQLCVEDIRPVFVADAFTPNGDGINDVLHVKAKGVKEMTFQVFDRWGNQVFFSNNLDDGWDGSFRGMNANAGVYVYIVEVKNINNESEIHKGSVTLVR